MRKIASSLLLLAAFSACQKGAEKTETATNHTPVTEAEPQKTDAPALPASPTGFTAIVNDLRVRELPKMDAKVVATLKQGDKMTGTGNVSTDKVTVDLRGQKVTDAFYEVTIAAGVKGWVFGGAVAKEGTAAAADNADVWLVTKDKVGKISANMTEADLVATFGKNNITIEKEIYANGDVPPFEGLTIFKGKPDELEIAWAEGKKGKKIGIIFIRNKGGQWHTKDGIKVGTTLADLNRINGKSFDFSGLGWDYGGYINDWKKGKLDNMGVSLRLNADGNLPAKYTGEVTVKSDEAGLAKAKIAVSELTISFR
jgi:hypothetical protein